MTLPSTRGTSGYVKRWYVDLGGATSEKANFLATIENPGT